MHLNHNRFLLLFSLILSIVFLANCDSTDNIVTKEPIKQKTEEEKSNYHINLIASIGVDEAHTEEEEPYQISSIYGVDCDSEGNIFILDGKSNCVRVFGQSGKFLRKMFRRGQGPQEIVNAYKIKYNPFSNSVFILNEHGFKLKQFDLMGNFLEDILLPRQVFGHFKFTSKDTLYYVSDCKNGKNTYDNIAELDIKSKKITNGFLHYSINQRDDLFRHHQKIEILNNILWTSTIDTMDLKGIDLSTGKIVKTVAIPGDYKKNRIYESNFQGQRMLGVLAFNVAQPLVLDNSLFVFVTIKEYDLKKRPKWKIVSSPKNRKTKLFKVMDDGNVVKINNFTQFDYSVLACTYKKRIFLSSYKPYPHLKIVEITGN